MDFEKLVSTATDQLAIGRAFGTAIERDGALVIPVALVAGGGGGGENPQGANNGSGSGGGYGGVTRPLGVYVVKDGKVRWVPAVNATAVAVVAVIAAAVAVKALIERGGAG